MFRGASLNTQPIATDPPTEARVLLLPWSWPADARILLAVMAVAIGLALRTASRNVGSDSGSMNQPSPELVLDPNTASATALSALPHIGPALANRMVEARSERSYSSLDDLRDRVRGVGPATLAQISPHLQIDLKPALEPQTLIASRTRAAGRKPRATRRKPARSTEPIPADDPFWLATIELSSQP